MENELKRWLREVLERGAVTLPQRALAEMAREGLDAVDAVNVLRGGAPVADGTLVRVKTQRMQVVVERTGRDSLTLVSAARAR